MRTIKRVMFVDDEIFVLKSLERRMRPFKEWEYSFANSVEEAIELANKRVPDIIVSDMRMPQKDGIFLIEHFKADEKMQNIPIVILSGSDETDLKKKALEAGAIDLVNKPISLTDLTTRISNVLKLKEYQDYLEIEKVKLESEVECRTMQLSYLNKDLIWRLAKIGEFRDNALDDHVERVAQYSRILGNACALSEKQVDTITLASTLHDIGKVGVPDSVLLKPGVLSNKEMQIMQEHVSIGSEILKCRTHKYNILEFEGDNDIFRKTAEKIVLTHHEKWDGTGYPNGLIEDNIPLEGRIVAIADVYDALRCERPYKKAFSAEKSYNIIVDAAGSHFDPELVELFKKHRKEFENIMHDINRNRVLPN